MLTQEKLKELFDYDQKTGLFTYRVSRGNKKAGSVADSLTSDGYIRIQISGKPYMAHVLAFLYVKGYLPDMVDHKDRIRNNNAWNNLRESTYSQNQRNKKLKSKSGYTNVVWERNRQKWRVLIRDKEGIKRSGGSFKHEELALAIDKANDMRKEFAGEFAITEEFDGVIPSLEYLNS
ncbi:TPA: HNH endonuclease [Salmonella enterica subsp. enterica serovar Saintpaul]